MQPNHPLLIALALSFFAAAPAAADYKPAEGPLMTRWAKEVSPDNALPEYPRPQMKREKWQNLNGLWQYAIRLRDEGQPEKWDGEILVPFAVESALSGVMKPVGPDNKLWYRRAFDLTPGYLTNTQRVLLNFGIPTGFSGPLSALSPPKFNLGPNDEWVWVRFTITDTQVPQDWIGDGIFDDGETEDYLLRVDAQPTSAPDVPDLDGSLRLDGAHPNPFNPRTTVVFTAARAAEVRLTIHDAGGRLVRTLWDGDAQAGRNEVSFDGTGDDGRSLSSGVYFARVEMGGEVETGKLVLIR